VRFSVAIVEEFRDVSPESGNLKVAIMDRLFFFKAGKLLTKTLKKWCIFP
jgi:hypothetical protein